jgi:fluoroquinolone transport system permease protein
MNQLLHSKTVRGLLDADRRLIGRDPTLLLAVCAPLLILVLFRFGLPPVSAALAEKTGFDLTPYYPLIASFLMLLQPMLLGMVCGFLMLDDRDEGVLSAIAITPLAHTGYLWYRMLMPVVASVAAAYVVLAGTGLCRFSYIRVLPVALMAGLEAPLMALFLVAFATNKVEGMALSKAGGIAVVVPVVVVALVPSPWDMAAAVFPAYWVVRAFGRQYANPLSFGTALALGLAVHTIAIAALWRVYEKRRG